jgi:hypothetical protein
MDGRKVDSPLPSNTARLDALARRGAAGWSGTPTRAQDAADRTGGQQQGTSTAKAVLIFADAAW